MKKNVFLICLFCQLFSIDCKAQTTEGKDFWLVYLMHGEGCFKTNPNYFTLDTLCLYLSSEYAANVKVSIPKLNYSASVRLKPRVASTFKLPHEVVGFLADTVTQNGVRVESDSLINVYALSRREGSMGIATVLPVSSIPDAPEYFVTTVKEYPNYSAYCDGRDIKFCLFEVVGIADSSVIEIIPTGSYPNNVFVGQSIEITLKKGETYQYMTVDRDLSGSILRSKSPGSKFAVFSGSRAATMYYRTGTGSLLSASDYQFEQMAPTVAWGKSYTAMPFKSVYPGYWLKIVASEDNTDVSINGQYFTTLQQGESRDVIVYGDSVKHITSLNKISVGQFMQGGYHFLSTSWTNQLGDPSFVQLYPDPQTALRSTFYSKIDQINFDYPQGWTNKATEHYVNVLCQSKDTSYFRIDSKKIPFVMWETSAALNGYHFARIQLDSGSHYLQNPNGFIAYAYGMAYLLGYAYTAGASLKPLESNFLVTNAQCVRDTIGFQAQGNSASLSFSWSLGDGSTDTGKIVRHKYSDTGKYYVRMFVRDDISGQKDTVIKLIVISDTRAKRLLGNDTLICGDVNVNLRAIHFEYGYKYQWNDLSSNYYRLAKKPGLYWLEVKERNGCVLRDSLLISGGPYPHAVLSVNQDEFCVNRSQDIVFSNHSSSEDSVRAYFWDFGNRSDTTTDKSVTMKHTFKTPGSQFVLLRAMSINHCYHDTFVEVKVLPSPDAQFSFTVKDTCFKGNRIVLKNNSVSDRTEQKQARWVFSEGGSLNASTTATHQYKAPGTYKVYLIYEYNNACIDTAIQPVDILPDPKALVRLSQGPYCKGDSVLFDARFSTPKPLTYQWLFSDNSRSSDSSFKKTLTSSGTQTLRLIVASVQGCLDTLNQSLSIHNPPLVDFDTESDTQCFNGHRFDFTNHTKFTGGSLNYQWQIDDGQTSDDSNLLAVVFAKDSVYRVKLKVSTGTGCVAERFENVYVLAAPAGEVIANKDIQCFTGQSFDFDQGFKVRNGKLQKVLWMLTPTDSVVSNAIRGYQFKQTGTHPVRVLAYSDAGCVSDTAKTIVVVEGNHSEIVLSGNDSQCLQGNGFDFKHQLLNSLVTINDYKWLMGDGQEQVVQDPVIVHYRKSGTYEVKLITVSNNNCQDTSSFRIEVMPEPKGAFEATEVCRGETTLFKNQSVVASGKIHACSWTFGDGRSSTELNPGHIYAVSGTYDVEFINVSDFGCRDTFIRLSGAVVRDRPVAKFDFSILPALNVNESRLQFNNQSSSDALRFEWDFGNQQSSTERDPICSYGDTGTFRVRLIAMSQAGCPDTFAMSTSRLIPQFAYFLPNAFSPGNGDVLNNDYKGISSTYVRKFRMEVFNRWGQKVFDTDNIEQGWDGNYMGEPCMEGIYLVRVQLTPFNSYLRVYEQQIILLR